MKISKFFVAIFVLSFLIGCASALLLKKETAFSTTVSEKLVFPANENVAPVKTLQKEIENPFAAEIFGLKDFSDDSVPIKYKIKLVDVAEHGSSYRKEEVIAKKSETWLGLFAFNNDSYLKNTKVKIMPEIDPDFDGVSIKFNKENPPLFLLKNAKNLKEGKVATVFQKTYSKDDDFQDNSNTMYRGFVREFQLGERKYVLRVKDALTKSGETVLALVLETENTSQVVTYGWYYDGDYLGSLLWVGDLDGDGKLDLYMDYNDWEKGYFSSSLFLSSEAEKGKLIKEAAGFYTAGC